MGVSVGGGRHPSWAAAGCHENPHPPDADALSRLLLLLVLLLALLLLLLLLLLLSAPDVPHTEASGRRVRFVALGGCRSLAKQSTGRGTSRRGRLGSDWDLAAKTMRWIGR